MIIQILFIISAMIVITGTFKFLGLVFNDKMIKLPTLIPLPGGLDCPTSIIQWYPSLGFQIWFWASYFNIFQQ